MSANEKPKGLSFRPKNIRTPKDVRDQRALEAQEREEEDYWWKYHGIAPKDQDRTRHNLSTRPSFSHISTQRALKRRQRYQKLLQRRVQQERRQQDQQLELPSFCQQPNQQRDQQKDQQQDEQYDQQKDQQQSQQFKLPSFCQQPQPDGALQPPYFEYRCPGKREFNEQVHQSFCQAQRLTVPVFKDIIISLLGKMANDEFEELKSINFPKIISEWGSLDEIAEIAIAQILPQFLELQGKPLTAEIIREIHQKQFEDPSIWTETDIGGYVLIGLDDRDERYIRYYVGQSFKLSTRLSHLRDYSEIRKLTDVFGIVATLTAQDIYHNFWVSKSSTAFIISHRILLEGKYEDPWTPSTLPTPVADWLYHIGFQTQDDLSSLMEAAGGNLEDGVQLVRVALSQEVPRRRYPQNKPNRGSLGPKFPESYPKVKQLLENLREKRSLFWKRFKELKASAFNDERRSEGTSNKTCSLTNDEEDDEKISKLAHYLPNGDGTETEETITLGEKMKELILEDDDQDSDLDSEDDDQGNDSDSLGMMVVKAPLERNSKIS
ncbi:unnamed protein product [Clonostachys byssicola]|uniref:Uncharacterized protein n=1 Tax=Clonostachys byssicola TaxID=160290 RepID=A0A9N9U013_9HYPO|nr:unnamed protein product [Clonostachys byssicola]